MKHQHSENEAIGAHFESGAISTEWVRPQVPGLSWLLRGSGDGGMVFTVIEHRVESIGPTVVRRQHGMDAIAITGAHIAVPNGLKVKVVLESYPLEAVSFGNRTGHALKIFCFI